MEATKLAPAAGGKVKGVRIAESWEEVDVDENDPLWSIGVPCPIPQKLGVPLIVRRDPGNPDTFTAVLDNQPVTYFMTHPKTGHAPPAWRHNVGPAIIARKDKKPLFLSQLDIIYEFMCDLIDDLEDEGGSVPSERMSKAVFREFWDEMVEEKKMSQQMDDEDEEEKGAMGSPTSVVDWDAVPRPF